MESTDNLNIYLVKVTDEGPKRWTQVSIFYKQFTVSLLDDSHRRVAGESGATWNEKLESGWLKWLEGAGKYKKCNEVKKLKTSFSRRPYKQV